MPTRVIMPQLGESVNEGTVTKWLRAKGDQVEEFEPLLEVNTDKVDTEVPSPASGVLLELLVAEGTTVQAGEMLAWIGEPGETTGSPAGRIDPAAETEPEVVAQREAAVQTAHVTEAPVPGRDRDLGFISPVVARIAREEGIDLSQVNGTGQGGRITKKDVLNYLEAKPKVQAGTGQGVPLSTRSEETPAAPAAVSSQPAQPAAEPVRPIEAVSFAQVSSAVAGELEPLTNIRRLIAQRMAESKRMSPHVTTVMEVDVTRMVAHQKANKATFERDGVKLTYTPYFMLAVVRALKQYPNANSVWTDQGVYRYQPINLGMATSLGDAGLVVPVIKNAEDLSLIGMARAVNDLASRARARKLQADEMQGGTFTVTNHGVTGSLFATPIINQPQCAILGVGAIQKRVVVLTGQDGSDSIGIRTMAFLSLTFDHRILDGATADNFLMAVVKSLENWE